MRAMRWISIAPVTAMFFLPVLTVQAEDVIDVSGHVAGGYQHDSNVTVDELNASADQSDEAWTFDAGLEGTLKPSRPLAVTLGYSLSGRRYQNLDQFDQNIHLWSADVSYDFEPVTVGASYHFSHATLGAEPFLEFQRKSVYVGTMVGESVYLRGSIQDKDKDFDDSNARDADIRGLSLDSFLFFNRSQSHVLFGLDGDQEDARADAYDNDLFRVRLALIHRFNFAGNSSRFRLSWRYEDRDYDQVSVTGLDPLLGDRLTGDLTERSMGRRSDKSYIVEATWRIGLTDIFSLEPSISHGRYTSSVDSADYDKTVAGLSLRAGF